MFGSFSIELGISHVIPGISLIYLVEFPLRFERIQIRGTTLNLECEGEFVRTSSQHDGSRVWACDPSTMYDLETTLELPESSTFEAPSS